MKEHIKINPSRLAYLRRLFGDMSQDELLGQLGYGKARSQDLRGRLETGLVTLAELKRIDAVFGRGLSYYTNPVDPVPAGKGSPDTSIFFRKQRFAAELRPPDYRFVSRMEGEIAYLRYLASVSDVEIHRKLPKCDWETTDPLRLADDISKLLDYPGLRWSAESDKDLVRILMDAISAQGVLVLEEVDLKRTEEKQCQLAGMYLGREGSNIGLKRHGNQYKRELFTLAHELAHCLADQEELDSNPVADGDNQGLESWCNEFAFRFLVGAEGVAAAEALADRSLSAADPRINALSEEFHVSRLAMFTHLRRQGKLGEAQYRDIAADLQGQWERYEKERKERRKERGMKLGGGDASPVHSDPEQWERYEEVREEGRAGKGGRKKRGQRIGSNAGPIHTRLEKWIYCAAYHEGELGEVQIINKFPLAKRDFDKFLYA